MTMLDRIANLRPPRKMYLTAQHVRSRDGREDVQAYLHLHDIPGSEPFPNEPFSVPQGHLGLMVLKDVRLPPGKNGVLSYLDIIARDAWWQGAPPPDATSTQYWRFTLEPVGELLAQRPLPWTAEACDVQVIFNAGPLLQQPPADEYAMLLGAALSLWDRWRSRIGLR
jgi:hypothetical protein